MPAATRLFTYRTRDVCAPDLFGRHLRGSPPTWGIKQPIVPRTIETALREGRLEAEPWDSRGLRPFQSVNERRRWHAGRIAYLVKHGWSDPILVEYCRRGLIPPQRQPSLASGDYAGGPND
jgi:hypothetical protein